MKVSRNNFKLKKFKRTQAGIMVEFKESVTLANNVVSTCSTNKFFKDDPQLELIDAIEAFNEIVMYDEDYKKGTEIKVTGITVFPDIDCAILTHLKETVSGNTARNSGRIGKESETFKLCTKLFDLIDILEDELYEFVFNGKRAQLALFGVDDEEFDGPTGESGPLGDPVGNSGKPKQTKKAKAMEVA